MNWLDRTIDGVSEDIPNLLLWIVKLNAVLIFTWYFLELLRADYGDLWQVRLLIGLSLTIFIIFVGKKARDAWPDAQNPAANAAVGHYYWLLVLAPLIAVAFLTLMYPQNHDFKSALIKATAEHLRSFWSWISQ